MRRAAVLKSAEQVAKDGGLHTENVQHAALHVWPVHAHGPTAQLYTIHHNVVMLPAHPLRVALQQHFVAIHRRSERVMRGLEPPVFPLGEEWEVFDPQELEPVRIPDLLTCTAEGGGQKFSTILFEVESKI